jgi:hypothetical protein
MKFTKTDFKVLAVILIAGITVIYSTQIMNIFRLDLDDTVYDFETSSIEERVKFMGRMWHDGALLDKKDWACGFTVEFYNIDTMDEISSCFNTTTKKAKSSTRLGEILKYCGKKFAIRTDELSNPDKCEEVGGKWGQLTQPSKIDFN